MTENTADQPKDAEAPEDSAQGPATSKPAAPARPGPPPLPAQPAQSPLALDPRRNAVREDLAALSLRGQVVSPRYAAGILRQIARPAVPLRRQPSADLGFETEALYGEMVKVYDEADGWAWVQLQRDRYVGYLPASTLTTEVMQSTHRVKSLGTFIYPAADIKTPPIMHLPLNGSCAFRNGASASRSSSAAASSSRATSSSATAPSAISSTSPSA
jgi:hypothetical protein